MATSPNFNWPEPDNTDLVKNGALAIRTAVDAIDSSLVDLKGGTTGQVLSKASNTDMDFAWVADAGAPTSYGYAAGKNKIINGDFGIWQRGTSLSGAGYLADRFQGVATTTTITQSQQAFTAGTAPVAGYESSYFYRAVTVTGGTAGSRALVQQPIEDVRTFAGQTVTISFWAKAASGTPKIGVELAQVFGSGGSSAVTGIGATAQTISTSWARYSVTISVPSISGKTIGTNSSLNLVLWIDAGSDFAARASSIGNQSGTFDIWGVQVETSNVATAFQTATGTIQGELAACQRYFERQDSTLGSTFTPFGMGACSSTTQAYNNIYYTSKRTNPSLSFTAANTFAVTSASYAAVACTAISAAASGLTGAITLATVASGLVAGNATQLYRNSSATAYIDISAEL